SGSARKTSPRTKSARSMVTAATAVEGSDTPHRSHTGEVLAAAIADSPRVPRKIYDFAAAEAELKGDVDIAEVGREAQMPWQANGRRWHTVDRVGRRGAPCRWEGRILEKVVDHIQDSGKFADTNWDARTIVEISSSTKTDGWFFHAVTGEEWLLKLKFRVAKNTFKRESLVAQLGLKPLNDLPDLPVYGHEPRIKCKNLRGPFQEVQLQVHSLDEIDKPAFWKFVDAAVAGFNKFAERVRQSPEDVMPWKVLGQKWHLSRKGFPPGKPPRWDVDVLEILCERLAHAAPQGQFLWNNQQLVHVFVSQQSEPWATIHTKRTAALDLVLTCPKGRFALGRIRDLGSDPELNVAGEHDLVRLRFNSYEDLEKGDLDSFLAEHLASLSTPRAKVAGMRA
ncbi:MAG TPA: excinuclease ABC subunit A, partial [Pirellulales bacterium]|nr:excinuclease ABC subunit A [Pirellulales bacterium]